MAAVASAMNNEDQKSWRDYVDARVYTVGIGIGGGGGKGQGEPVRDEHAIECERTYTTFQHLVGLVRAIDGGMGFLSLIGAIIMWRIKADQSPFYDDHGREAVNFQISLLVYFIGGAVVLGLFTIITLGIGAFLAVPLGAIGVVFLLVLRFVGCIRGAIAANRGEYYRYPMCLRFLV